MTSSRCTAIRLSVPCTIVRIRNSAFWSAAVMARTTATNVMRTPGWWQFIWHEHRGSFEPPPIDFSRQMIVAVFGGSAGAGSSIEIIAAVREGASIVVRYREQLRPRDAKSLTPFHIVAIPADRSTVTFVRLTAS